MPLLLQIERVTVYFRTMGYLLRGVALMIQRAFSLECGLVPLWIVGIIALKFRLLTPNKWQSSSREGSP
ncbi:hypothetical protein B932_1875 [Gluconobacter oxydans H24]|nr:hypothetical protein B932_1875 [Gluconobacter oxydans H24]